MLITFRNKVFVGSKGRKSVFDCEIPNQPKGMIIFVHGYKGYKDWGAWNLVQTFFLSKGYGFLKFNMTHNGGTVEDPIDFPDLEAFGENRYSYELEDLKGIVKETHRMISEELFLDLPITLIGHSRGGGIVLLEGSRDDLVSNLVSWAGISDIKSRFPIGDELETWKRDGVIYVKNGRTNQEMPHFYSFYEDFVKNEELLNIEEAVVKNQKPLLIVHGDMDISVSISEGQVIAKWAEERVCIIKGADHTFGTKHPWNMEQLSDELEEVLKHTLEFIENQSFKEE